MNTTVSKSKTISSLFWQYGEKICVELVSFVISIILARLLVPEAYGTVALVTVLNAIILTLSDSGVWGALMQKKAPTDTDYSTAFYFKIATAIPFFVVVCLASGALASFYGNDTLAPMICVCSIRLIIDSAQSVPRAYAQKTFQFKKFFWSSLIGTIASGIVGITMAYLGFGVWALICSTLADAIVDTIMIYVFIKWRPKRLFSWMRLKEMLSFGWKMLIADLISNVYSKGRQLIIGKIYTLEDLAYYNRGNGYANLLVGNVNSTLNNVLLPTMAAVQDDPEKLRHTARRAVKVGSYIIFPALMGFALCAEPLVELILTEKWLPCVPFIRIFCLANAFNQIQTTNIVAIMSKGRSDLLLKMEIIRRVVAISVLLLVVPFGVRAMAYSLIPVALFETLVDIIPNKKNIGYGVWAQVKDLLPTVLITVAMGICVYAVSLLPIYGFVLLIEQIAVGVAVYVLLSVVFEIDSFFFLLNTIKAFAGRFGKGRSPKA